MFVANGKAARVLLAAILLFSLLSAMLLTAVPAQAAANEIAYIYDTDGASANSYKSLLDANGYSVTLIQMDDVATTDFSGYGLIIVGNDTGNLWDDNPDSVLAVDDSAKPIIGLGEGGYDFLGEIGLDIGTPYGAHGSENRIYAVDTSHTIFNTPNAITIPVDNLIELYTTSVGVVHIYLWPSIPPDVVTLGRHATDTGYYPLVQQGEIYLLWGFHASPDDMTQAGKDLFVNVVYNLIPLPSSLAWIAGPIAGGVLVIAIVVWLIWRRGPSAPEGG